MAAKTKKSKKAAVGRKQTIIRTEDQKRYTTTWRNKFLTVEAKSIQEMASIYQDIADTFNRMIKDGVTLDPNGGVEDDYATLVTTDPKIAKKYDFEEEESYDEEEDGGCGDFKS